MEADVEALADQPLAIMLIMLIIVVLGYSVLSQLVVQVSCVVREITRRARADVELKIASFPRGLRFVGRDLDLRDMRQDSHIADRIPIRQPTGLAEGNLDSEIHKSNINGDSSRPIHTIVQYIFFGTIDLPHESVAG